MFNDYRITMESFGQDCPTNWEEIADYLNARIDEMQEITDPETGDLTPAGRDQIDEIWAQYCEGNLPDAPAPIMD